MQTEVLHACDSVYKLELYVAPIFHKDTVVTICERDSFYWEVTKSSYSVQGVYNYSTTTACGCDSTFTLYLTVNPVYEKDTVVRICNCNLPYIYPGDFFVGDTLIKAGRYCDTLQTIHGCDSILNLTFFVDSCYEFIENDTVCFNKSYTWKGHESVKIFWPVADTTYVFYDSLKTVYYGCDSVYILKLFVQPSYRNYTTINLCDNDTYIWKGEVFDKARIIDQIGSAKDIYSVMCEFERCARTKAGCDSCSILRINLCPTYFYEINDTICANESFTWINHKMGHDNDTTFMGLPPGNHTIYDSLQTTVYGCDSVYKLNLVVLDTFLYETTVSICANESFTWIGHKMGHDNDTTFMKLESGKTHIYYDSLKTKFGCDSVYKLNLIVLDTFFDETRDTICDNDIYIWEGHKKDTIFRNLVSGEYIYYDSLKTIFGCDSVYHLYLTVNPTSDTIVYDTICCGDSYRFGARTLTLPGVYEDTLINQHGCDSTIVLHLDTITPTKMDATILDACADDKHLIIPYTYVGRKPIEYSVKFDTDAKEQGFEDVEHQEIKEDSVLLVDIPRNLADRREYPRPDYYKATIFLHNGICSDSLVMEKETFLIKYPSWITEQHWNDVISLLNDRYNGGYTFSKYQWFHNGVPIPGEDSSYIYQPLIMGDEYYAELTRTDDGKTIATCPIYPKIVIDSVIPYPYAEIVPSIIPKNNPNAEIKCLEKGKYTIYSLFGIRVQEERQFDPPSTPIPLGSLSSGTYIVIFETTNHNRRHIQRIVIN